MDVYLETDRLILRQFTPEDLENLIELDSDPEVMRYISGKPTPPEVIEERILPTFLDYYRRFPGFGFWAAIEKTSGEFLGWFCLRPRDDSDVQDIGLGYRLRRAVWGKGYATEGSRALIRKAFAELGVQRVFAITYGENLRSRRVMEKAGLRLVRTFRYTPADLAEQDTYDSSSPEPWEGDDVEYALEKEEWKQRQAAAADRPGDESTHFADV